MYKEAVRVLEPVDLEYGIMKKHDVANRKWTDWRYSTNHKKHTRKVSFEDDPFFNNNDVLPPCTEFTMVSKYIRYVVISEYFFLKNVPEIGTETFPKSVFSIFIKFF